MVSFGLSPLFCILVLVVLDDKFLLYYLFLFFVLEVSVSSVCCVIDVIDVIFSEKLIIGENVDFLWVFVFV